MSINFVIVDDQAEVLSCTTFNLRRFLKEEKCEGHIAMTTTSPLEVLEYSKQNSDELNAYILDINFNHEINGLAVAREIRENEPYAYIIFLTAHPQLSMLTFKYKLKVFDFLVKPVFYADFKESISAIYRDVKLVKQKQLPTKESCLKVTSGYHEHEVPINSIICIESLGPKLRICCESGELETYYALKTMEENLKQRTDCFCRIHKSYIINMNMIEYVDFNKLEVVLRGGLRCLISRAQKQNLKENMERFKLKII